MNRRHRPGDVGRPHPDQLRQLAQGLDIGRPTDNSLTIGQFSFVVLFLPCLGSGQHQPGFRRVAALGEGAAGGFFSLDVPPHVPQKRRQVVLRDAAGRSGLHLGET
ncbi:hypothetical protein D3C72_1796660 [compost metagenome]